MAAPFYLGGITYIYIERERLQNNIHLIILLENEIRAKGFMQGHRIDAYDNSGVQYFFYLDNRIMVFRVYAWLQVGECTSTCA